MGKIDEKEVLTTRSEFMEKYDYLKGNSPKNYTFGSLKIIAADFIENHAVFAVETEDNSIGFISSKLAEKYGLNLEELPSISGEVNG